MMEYGSVCSGIEAATVAWHMLGWKPAWFSEIEAFPSAVLAHHYPKVPNLGDMTKIAERVRSGEIHAPDVLVGGTPCQAFSVAGLRNGLSDARGALTISFVELANAIDATRSVQRLQPAVVWWENVPGVLSSRDNAFGCFLGALAGEDCELQPAGGRWANAGCVFGPKRAVAWRILDAQYFGVAQRRRRVFVVASARAGFNPAAVLFEFEGVRRDSAPSRQPWEEVTPTIRAGAPNGGAGGRPDGPVVGSGKPTIGTLMANAGTKLWLGNQEALSGDYHILQPTYGIPGNWIGRKPENGGNAVEPMHDVAPCLTKADRHGVAAQPVAVVCPSLTASNDPSRSPQSSEVTQQVAAVLEASMQVRRLTPVECERLQGFPDNYTLIPVRNKPAADGPRYKALGNSMAVPVMRWIGWRVHFALLQYANDNTPPAAPEVKP